MQDFIADIKAFHEKFELVYDGKPRLLPLELKWFREVFMGEELNEYKEHTHDAAGDMVDRTDEADVTHALEQALDALVDLTYVVLGTAYLHGFDFEEAWRRVHTANMNKVRVLTAFESKRGSAYDVRKPDGWQLPSHKDLVEDHAHREAKRVTPITELLLSELRYFWSKWDGINDVGGYTGEDIHAELNRRGDGKYCAV